MKYARYRQDNQNTGDDNVFWVTMSDLLLGLVVVFLVLFDVCYYRLYTEQSQRT